MRNWKTTLFGTGASILGSLATIETPYQKFFVSGAAICGVLFSLFSKDKNVSGQKLADADIGLPVPKKK